MLEGWYTSMYSQLGSVHTERNQYVGGMVHEHVLTVRVRSHWTESVCWRDGTRACTHSQGPFTLNGISMLEGWYTSMYSQLEFVHTEWNQYAGGMVHEHVLTVRVRSHWTVVKAKQKLSVDIWVKVRKNAKTTLGPQTSPNRRYQWLERND